MKAQRFIEGDAQRVERQTSIKLKSVCRSSTLDCAICNLRPIPLATEGGPLKKGIQIQYQRSKKRLGVKIVIPAIAASVEKKRG